MFINFLKTGWRQQRKWVGSGIRDKYLLQLKKKLENICNHNIKVG